MFTMLWKVEVERDHKFSQNNALCICEHKALH